MVSKRSIRNYALSLVLALSAGCAAHSPYDTRLFRPQKDIVLVAIRVAARLEPEEYRRIARAEIRKVLASRAPDDVPLYEVRFEFLAPLPAVGQEEVVADLVWRIPAGRGTPDHQDEITLALY